MKKAWHDPRNKEYGSDSNALRRLFESMEQEDGYNKQVGKLMFRCADELERLSAENEKMTKALLYVLNSLERDEQLEGIDFANELYEINAALSGVKQEMDTCVWTWCCFGNWHTSCGNAWGGVDKPDTCIGCGRRIEVKR